MSESVLQPLRKTTVLMAELAVIAMLVLVSRLVVNSPALRDERSLVAWAVIFDLTITVALCHWFLAVRSAGWPGWTVIPMLAVGLALSQLLLQGDSPDAGVISLVIWALIEGTILTLMIIRIRRLVRAYRKAKRAGADGFDALELAFLEIAPRVPFVAAWVRLEVQLWALFLVGWSFKRTPPDGPHTFTHHERVNWFTIAGVLGVLAVIEGALVHWILDAYSYDVAKWIFTALNVYAAAWVTGDAQALRVYRTSITTRDGELTLDVRVGLRGRLATPMSNIAKLETGSWEKARPDDELLVLLGPANVRLSFVEPAAFRPMFGGAKSIRSLLLQIDEADAFERALRRLLNRGEPA